MRAMRIVRAALLENWWLKLASILLAYALWLLIRGGEGERVVQVPVVVKIPSNMIIMDEHPRTIEVTLGGALLPGIQADISYNVDLQSAAEGKQTIALSPEKVQLGPAASGLRVLQVEPSTLTLVLERIIIKTVPVKAVVLGSPAPGLELYKTTCFPGIVVLKGPHSKVEAIKDLKTEPVLLAGQDRSFQARVNSQALDDDIDRVQGGPIVVNVELGPHREMHVLKVSVAVLDDHENCEVRPESVEVSVLVPVTFKKRLSANDCRATVSDSNMKPTDERVSVKPDVKLVGNLDSGIVISQIIPEKVTLIRKPGKR